MKKRQYTTPTSTTINVRPKSIMTDDFVIAVSGTTIPEDSDGKGTDFEDDMEENEFIYQLPLKRYSRLLWDDDWQ